MDLPISILQTMHVLHGRPLQARTQFQLRTMASLLFSVVLAGCNAAPPQPNSQPAYVPRDNSRHERRDRDQYPSRDGSYAANHGFPGESGDRRESHHRDSNRRGRDSNNGSGNGDYSSYSSSSNHRAMGNTPGQFDFYLLNFSWAPEYCYGHANAPECTAHSAFVLHGLWPQNNNGTYPENCADMPGPADPNRYPGLYPTPGLLQHEWRTHGTCTGLTPDAYLAAAVRARQEIIIPPTLAHLNQATSMPPAGILNLFQQSNPGLPAGSLALSCGHNFLTAVEVCLDKNLHPAACGQVRSCQAAMVQIPAP